MDNRQIVEALQLQPLTDEEKAARKILGRLCGPIATCTESTRNGRKYNKQLWETALGDDLFKEKIQNKCLFLELGHPRDREETDMREVCACIPEIPKIINNDLYAYVDILDTPNGKLLKTLCDYGFVPGISSRGSGDIMDNDEVDPETFFLETFDVVSVPAVKKARLSMCESLEQKKPLEKALNESLSGMDAAGKEKAQETLKNLGVDVNLTEASALKEDDEYYPGGTPKDIDEIPFAAETVEDNEPLKLTEDVTENEDEVECDWCHDLFLLSELKDTDLGRLCDRCIADIKSRGECVTVIHNRYYTEDVDVEDGVELTQEETVLEADQNQKEATTYADPSILLRTLVDSEWQAIHEYNAASGELDRMGDDYANVIKILNDIASEEAVHVGELEKLYSELHPGIAHKIEAGKEEATEKIEEDLTVPAEESTDCLVKDLIKEIATNYDKNGTVACDSVEIEGKWYETEINLYKDDEGNLKFGVNCIPFVEDSEIEEKIASEDIEEIELNKNEIDSAEDNGEDEVIEQLKETIRQKDSLEEEVKTLRGVKAVGDSKVKQLEEELTKYKSAFERMSAVAAMNKKSAKEVSALTEQLTQKNQEIESLKQASKTKITESLQKSENNSKQLKEELKSTKEELNNTKAQLNEQLKNYKNKVVERTNLAKAYKSKYMESMNTYIKFRASLLGVNPNEITSKLNENYTITDIDSACDKILTENVNISKLPFGINKNSKIRINESRVGETKQLNNNPDDGYEIDDSLLELAGLKN